MSCPFFSIMHNKFMVIDGMFVQTGSYNYTMRAEQRNAENALFIHSHSAEVAQRYQDAFDRLWAITDPGCEGRTGG